MLCSQINIIMIQYNYKTENLLQSSSKLKHRPTASRFQKLCPTKTLKTHAHPLCCWVVCVFFPCSSIGGTCWHSCHYLLHWSITAFYRLPAFWRSCAGSNNQTALCYQQLFYYCQKLQKISGSQTQKHTKAAVSGSLNQNPAPPLPPEMGMQCFPVHLGCLLTSTIASGSSVCCKN